MGSGNNVGKYEIWKKQLLLYYMDSDKIALFNNNSLSLFEDKLNSFLN